ncbi:hypothetical protein GCM10027418_22430 [Mariniluteicoccus endophyticus]
MRAPLTVIDAYVRPDNKILLSFYTRDSFNTHSGAEMSDPRQQRRVCPKLCVSGAG